MSSPLYWQAKALEDILEKQADLTKEQVLERMSNCMINMQKMSDSRVIIDTINNFSFSDKQVAEDICNAHRTLQQSFMRLCLEYIKRQADTDMRWTDARNEATVKLSKRIVEAIGIEDMYVPMI